MNGRFFKVITALLLGFLGPVVHAAGTVTYVYTDPQGTPLAEANAGGAITATFDYKPYGSQALGSPKADPGYTGHVNDPDTGFVYMQARYYDPVVGRFLSVDPVTVNENIWGNFNRFWYANDNPERFTDPDGRNATEALGGLFAETWSFVKGEGFHGSQIYGALKDGYNGQGDGILGAALQDANTITIAAGAAGIAKGGATLIAGRFAAKEAVEEGAGLAGQATKKGLGNPFKNKTAQEIDEMFAKKGFTRRGDDPVGGTGGYVNPKTGRSYHIDPKEWGKYREPNHVDVNRSRGYKGLLEKKKYEYKGG